MKTNLRRRVLISSLAMLLVALVALSTATFAWFTTSTTTTANGLNVKTIKSSELVISKSDRAWTDTINYSQDGKTLRPASTADGKNWFSGTAATKGNFAIANDGTFASVTGNTAYYFEEELNVANRGYAAVKDVTITVSGFTNTYARMAIVEIDPDSKEITGTFTDSVFDSSNETYNAVTGAAKTATKEITAKNTISVSVGQLEGKAAEAGADDIGGAKYYKLLVWFEGQDQQCYDTNAGQSLSTATDGVVISISGTTVDQ
jgi:hypothetical protein